MSPALFLALQLVASAAEVKVVSNQPGIELDGKPYRLVQKGQTLSAKVSGAAPKERLEVDVIRLGAPDAPRRGQVSLTVHVGRRRHRIRARPPLEPDRRVGERIASYPVRHRFPLPSGAATVRITATKADDGVLVFLSTSAPHEKAVESAPSLVPLEPLAQKPPEKKKRREKRRRTKTGPDVSAARQSPTQPSPQAEPPPPTEGGEAPPPSKPPADAPPPTDPPPAPAPAPAPAPGPAPTLPLRLSAQVAAGSALHLAGALQPLVLSGGVRFHLGARDGWLRRYSFGLGLDFEHQAAASRLADVRWDATLTRLRLEAEATLIETTVGPLAVDARLLGGGGIALGAHAFFFAGREKTAPLFGPTFRLALSSSARLGPGALVLALPLDASVDTAGVAKSFAPIAAGLTLGYRLEL